MFKVLQEGQLLWVGRIQMKGTEIEEKDVGSHLGR